MAKIGIENIKKINLKVWNRERKFSSKTIDPLVTKMYEEKKYDKAPKSRKEADERGIKNFNGSMSSFITVTESDGVVYATIAATRYLVGQAMRDVIKVGKEKDIIYTPQQILTMSTDMANVSLIAPVKVNGKYFLLSQIKGKALGSGQVHTGLVAGNIASKYLDYSNPLIANLQNECSEEVGMDLSQLNPSSFIYMVDERETGQVNFAAVAERVDASNVLDSYETMTKPKIGNPDKKLEVMALALIPIENLSRGNDGELKDIPCYFPTENGLERRIEDRGIRPYTQATLDYISKTENVKFLLEKAGY